MIQKISLKNGDTELTVRFYILPTNIDSLQHVIDSLNSYAKDKIWKYAISQVICSPPLIIKEYKLPWNKDGSSGITIYGEELKHLASQ